MASLSDMLTAAKNFVTAINQIGQVMIAISGSKVQTNITAPTLVYTGQGWVARVSVVVAGSAEGAIYDAASATATTNKIASLPTTVGITDIKLPVNNGIVVAPGTGQTIAISYS